MHVGAVEELSRRCVGAVECNEAAIFSQTIESQTKDQNQKIAAFGSSYRTQCVAKSPSHKDHSEDNGRVPYTQGSQVHLNSHREPSCRSVVYFYFSSAS